MAISDIVNIQIKIFPEITLGLDGEVYSLEIQNGLNSVKYFWWTVPPKSWQSLKIFSDKLISYVQAKIKLMESNR
ncbi:hypothetical protein ES703_103405 [subsurface metagenome]